MSTEVLAAARKTPSFRMTDTETQIDFIRLRGYRLQRLRDQLRARDLGACVLFDPINIRYATGSRNATMFQMHVPMRFVFVPAEGPVILYDGEAYKHVARGLETIDEVRPPYSLSFFFAGSRVEEMIGRWADEVADVMRQHGNGSRRLAIDICDPRGAAALADRRIAIVNAQETVERARAIKSAEEILCMNIAITAAEVGMMRMQEALKPGISENELWSLLYQANLALGGEWIEGRLLVSGDRTNPWLQESSDRIIRPGELVAFDTDMVGPLGYCADISRTFFCGPGKPSPEQRDLYKLAYEELQHNLALVKPGVSFREFAEKTWKQPADCAPNRYMVAAHGIGLCDEYPSIYYRQDWDRIGYEGIIEEDMTLCVESYMGRVGGDQGVKLEQQVLVTSTGCVPLVKYPFEESLLA